MHWSAARTRSLVVSVQPSVACSVAAHFQLSIIITAVLCHIGGGTIEARTKTQVDICGVTLTPTLTLTLTLAPTLT